MRDATCMQFRIFSVIGVGCGQTQAWVRREAAPLAFAVCPVAAYSASALLAMHRATDL